MYVCRVRVRHRDIVVVELPLIVDFHTEREVHDAVLDALTGDCRHLVLSLEHTRDFDSSGLNLLLGIRRHTKDHDISLSLTDLPPFIAKMLSITRTDTVLAIHPTILEAIHAANSATSQDQPMVREGPITSNRTWI
ncbi:STAS domain-containing protein [Streptomyces sp. NPDC005385]|uniref:STAS domain-containing protein n=1 Tax=Streptomyces sp. NPDC005385 TaxID=3157039 RepID=UPI0033B6BFE6